MPSFASVLFDCDSTLSAMEGIDELARDVKPKVEALTDQAMRGELPLEDVYGKRLEIIRPSREELERVGRMYVERLVPGARDAVAALHAAGVEVRIISGGLRPAVLHVGRALGVDESRVFAVDIYFDSAGAYAGFEESSPLATQRGKALLVASWSTLPRPSMLVGDGSTDLETKGVVDCFVAFAGVVERELVVANADVVVREASLEPVAALALRGDVRSFSKLVN